MNSQQKSSSWNREIIGGLTTFFTVCYIVIVNPAILATQGTGLSFSGVMTATVALCFLMTMLMGVYAKLPFAVAPGMGINAFLTYSVILGKQIPWPIALGLTFWAGVVFLLVSLTPIREKIALAIPSSLRAAAAIGIGLFLTFIGLKNAGIIVADQATFVRFGGVSKGAALTLLGLVLIVFFSRRKNPFAFLISMVSITLLASFLGLIVVPDVWFAAPDFQSVMFKADLVGSLQLALLPILTSIMLTDLFDSISTLVGVSTATGLVDEKGQPKNLKQGLVVDAWATLGAGLLGTSSGTAFIESAAGIEAGGRTGRSAIVTALCFLPCFFIAPLAGMVPAAATAPVLIYVGSLMFKSVAELKLGSPEDALPAFLTAILIPLTFSITQGILWGFIFHVVLYVLAKRYREVSPTMYLIALVAAIMLVLDH